MSAQNGAAKGVSNGWAPAWSFAVTILLSAFLLFQVQPLISKAILPWFGGCPAVWTTCMLFFQLLLFGGYVYAHLLQRWLVPRGQVLVHLALAAAALLVVLATHVTPSPGWKPTGSDAPTWRILVLLTATVGLPYFVLSATAPLVQAWFSHSYPGLSPYRLYALSNVGSLAALLSYPFFFERALDLKHQSLLWSAAFLAYAALCSVCLLCLWRLRQTEPQTAAAADLSLDPVDDPPPTLLHRVLWLALPACGSLMLLATTNHVCQDVAVVPFLWIVPLTLYLLSFIICFDHERWYLRGVWPVLALLAIMAVTIEEGANWQEILRDSAVGESIIQAVGDEAFSAVVHPLGFVEQMVLYFSTLFFVCMVCHGELVRLRPHPRYLTEFYLLISAGGALGGVFVSLVAPVIFTTFFEWPIGLAACYAIAAAALGLAGRSGKLRLVRNLVVLPLAAAGLAGIVVWEWQTSEVIDRARNFYGVVSVDDWGKVNDPDYEYVLQHGHIIHGRQFADPDKRQWATTYYSDESGVGRAICYYRERGNIRVGAVGLGVGTLAAYAQPGDYYQFYEINPEVKRMAEKYFTYLSDCRERLRDAKKCRIVMGDARLSLENQEPQRFDVLVLDAFSGDSIPVHLLTREAFEIYRRHLAPNGVIAVHITNTYLYLAPVVRGLAKEFRLKTTRIYTDEDSDRLMNGADWMLLSKNQTLLDAIPPEPPNDVQDDFTVPLWTDQYSTLFQILQKP